MKALKYSPIQTVKALGRVIKASEIEINIGFLEVIINMKLQI